jgi:hypothetical protein
MERLNDIPMRPAGARPKPAPAMVMAPDKSRFQRHSAHLRTRIIGAAGIETTGPDTAGEQLLQLAEAQELATENDESAAAIAVDVASEQDNMLADAEQATVEAEDAGPAQDQ